MLKDSCKIQSRICPVVIFLHLSFITQVVVFRVFTRCLAVILSACQLVGSVCRIACRWRRGAWPRYALYEPLQCYGSYRRVRRGSVLREQQSVGYRIRCQVTRFSINIKIACMCRTSTIPDYSNNGLILNLIKSICFHLHLLCDYLLNLYLIWELHGYISM